MRKLFILSFFVFFVAGSIAAQELNCKVQVMSQQVQGTNKQIFGTLQTAIFEFMNNKKWTTDSYKNDERIDCSILINITSLTGSDFVGTLQVQVRRPVYKSSYNTVLLNYNDNDIAFTYVESQPLEFNDNTYLSELTSILGYYAYLIIGMDYDTFALNGGTPYLQKCLAVVNNAQNSSAKGWKAFDSNKNRYWLINNMLDASFVPLRECMYTYHRKGLDIMADKKEEGRAVIAESIESIRKVHQIKPLSFNAQVFFFAKADEIINIFSGGTTDEKTKVISTLNVIDPTNSNKYQKIMQQ